MSQLEMLRFRQNGEPDHSSHDSFANFCALAKHAVMDKRRKGAQASQWLTPAKRNAIRTLQHRERAPLVNSEFCKKVVWKKE